MRSVDVVVAGHVCLDLIPDLSNVAAPGGLICRPGGLIVIGPPAIAGGGAVHNVGIALHRLGVPVGLVGKVGDDLFGRELLRLLQSHDPSLASGMRRSAGEATSYSLVISPPGVDRSFLHCPGANRTFGFEDMDFDLVAGARLMHLGYPPSMDRLCREDAVELHAIYRKCRELGVTTSLDLCAVDPGSPAARLDWRRIFQRILPEVDIFQPSLDELCQMLQVSPTQEAQHLHHLAGELLAMGCAVVVIKLGESGIYVQTTSSATRLAAAGRGLQTVQPEAWLDQKLHHPCFVANFVSATGAGDCTIAGLLAAVLRGEPAAQAIRSACAVGACSVEAPDATSGVPAWEQVQARLDAGWETHPTPSPFRLRAG